MQHEQGFTLIELIVVLTIVAVLAAIALPRFVDLQRETRIGHLQGVRGAVATAASLVHAAVLSRRGLADTAACPASPGIVADNALAGPGSACTEAGVVRTQHAYPASTPIGTPGIVSAAGIGGSFLPSAAALAAEGYAVVVAGGVTTFQRVDARVPASCSFTYREPPAAGASATFSAVVTSGC